MGTTPQDDPYSERSRPHAGENGMIMKSKCKASARRVRRLVHALLRRPDSSLWEHGTVNGQAARRHKITGGCQFVLRKAGEQGHTEDYWHRFGDGHEKHFRMNEKDVEATPSQNSENENGN